VVGGRESTRVRGTRRAAVREKLESIVDDWRHGWEKRRRLEEVVFQNGGNSGYLFRVAQNVRNRSQVFQMKLSGI
jgi:hypothetical protein